MKNVGKVIIMLLIIASVFGEPLMSLWKWIQKLVKSIPNFSAIEMLIFIIAIMAIVMVGIYLSIDIYASNLAMRKTRKKLRLTEGEWPNGTCYTYWDYKKRILKKFGINWKSPAEKNPDILFD